MRGIIAHFNAQSLGPRVPDPAPVKVVGVYRDVSDYIMATHQLQRIANRCPLVGDFESTWWSFDALKQPREVQEAARAAAEADLIWCSACACEPLPKEVAAWVRQWSVDHSKPDAALVSLLRCPLSGDFERSPTRLCLCNAARVAGVEFFERRLVCDCPQADDPLTGIGIPPPAAGTPGDRQIRWWGINE